MNELDKSFIYDFTFQMDFQIRDAIEKNKEKHNLLDDTPSWDMDVAIAEATRFALGWVEAAAQFHNNEQYYRGLLDQIGEAIGKKAFICDDGSISSSVLRAKLPQLVRQLVRITDGSSH